MLESFDFELKVMGDIEIEKFDVLGKNVMLIKMFLKLLN